jgi:acetylornithine deacetylase
MKGPLAATIVAANQFETAELKKPLYIIVTADEEMGYGGARQVVTESRLLQANWPAVGVVAEPTELIPVYAHKGGVRLNITAHGRSAHTSTDQGVSANFLIAPFLAEMAQLHARFMSDEYYFDPAFNPPTIGFNMVLDDGGTKPNVTAAKTVCTVGFRTTTGDHRAEIIEMIEERARHYDLSCSWVAVDPFTTDPEAEIVQAAIQATGGTQAVTVPFGTEATLYKDYMQTVVLGPGNIAQAHTVGEWIELNQLHRAVEIYQQLITKFCL